MPEKILAISENAYRLDGWESTSGYRIITDSQEIIFGISDIQSCCETWGYFMSDDNLQDFIGSELISVSLVNEALEKVSIEHKETLDMAGIATMFVNFETSNGLLQFVAYNSHNGYYGHTAFIKSKQLTHDESL